MEPVDKKNHKTPAAPESLPAALRTVVLTGAVIIFLFFVCFGGWLTRAPLASAAVASGIVSPDSSRKAIQHLEGGIVRDILVKDGDYVRAGTVLMRFDDTQARAQFQSMQLQHLRLRAIRARLAALQSEAADLQFDPSIVAASKDDQDFASFLAAQADLFKTRRSASEGRREMLKSQIEQINEQISGLTAEAVGNETQLELINEELAGLQTLLKDGNALKSRVLQVQRARAEVSSKLAATKASLASAHQKISEVKIAIVNSDIEFKDKLADEHMRINSEIAQLEERLQAARDVLSRTTVVSPVEGTVMGLRFKTTAGVVRPGEVIVQVVPAKDELVIDARVQPIDIRSVKVGQLAQVHLLPYQDRNLPIIEGKVLSVSADTVTDERTNERYYEAKVVVERDGLAKIAPEIQLSPGMPAEVLIVTGERSALRYLLEPIERSFRVSFRQI